MSWNEEKVAKLKELCKGNTASQIAEIIEALVVMLSLEKP